MTNEQSLVFIKPDAVQKGYVDSIIDRFESAGLHIKQQKQIHITSDLADQHYAEHVDRPFYPGLKEFITSGPVVVMIIEGLNAVAHIRELCGATNPDDADAGTIRSDFGESMTMNAIHASDSVQSAEREMAIFF